MATSSKVKASTRAKLVAAASELFYKEGVHTVGIDRVIEHAGVSKGTLYNAFESKDELIRAYLSERHARTVERMTRELATRFDNPRDRLIGVFEIQGMSFTDPGFRGCAFISASAESLPGSVVEEVAEKYRQWVRTLFHDLAVDAGAPDPTGLAKQLVILYDGAGISAWMDHDPAAATSSRAIATALVDAAIPRTRRASRNSAERRSPASCRSEAG